jgi:hypothetical protein
LAEQAIFGVLVKSVAGSSDVTLTNTDGQLNEARNATYEFTGALTGNISVIIPTSVRKHVVFNNTTGAFTLTVKTAAGTGIAVPQGKKMTLYCDGTNVVEGLSAVGHLTVVGSIDESKGANIASAATTTIWATDGNYVHVTGTTTITSFGTAARAGARRKVIFDGILTLTNGANLILPTGANIVTAAGDVIDVVAETTTQHRVVEYARADGSALTVPATITGNKVFTGTVQISSTTAVNNLTVSSTDAGAVGPKVRGYHASASPAANDVIFAVESAGKDSAANDTEYGDLQHVITDPNNTGPSEDSEWRARASVAGVKTEILRFGADGTGTPGVQIGTPTGGYKGAGTVNAAGGLYANGNPTGSMALQNKTATYTVTTADMGQIIRWTTAGFAANLPAASTWAGQQIELWNDASTGDVTIDPSGTETIDGLATRVMRPTDRVVLTSDGSNIRTLRGRYSFTGSAITPNTSSATAQAHGLGMLPTRTQAILRCLNANLGYSTDDEIELSTSYADTGAVQGSAAVVKDATNVTLLQATNLQRILNKSTPSTASAINATDWRFVMRAWVEY